MLISKITYVGNVLNTSTSPNIQQLTFKNNSSTEKYNKITTATWESLIISGAPVLLNTVNTDDSFVIGIQNNTTFQLVVKLSVTNDVEEQAVTTCIIYSTGLNISVFTLDLVPHLFHGGLVNYELQPLITVVQGISFINSYDTYYIDLGNTGVTNFSQNSDVPISYVHTSKDKTYTKLSANVNSININNSNLYSLVSLTPNVVPGNEVEVRSTDECENISVYSYTTDVIDKLVGRGGLDNSSMTHLSASININCCNKVNNILLGPTYDLNLSVLPGSFVSTPNQITIGSDVYNVYRFDLVLGGISPDIISTITNTSLANNNPIISNITPFTGVIEDVEFLVAINPVSPHIIEFNNLVITNSSGFVYTINYEIFGNSNGTAIVFNNINVTYPTYPNGISILNNVNNTSLEISTSGLFDVLSTNAQNNKMLDGIYTITLGDSDISNKYYSGCVFVNCTTYCRVIKALANGCSPLIKIIYDALANFEVCSNMTCEYVCHLYSHLNKLLNKCDQSIYQTNAVTVSNDCGCN